jgi:glycine oxidase
VVVLGAGVIGLSTARALARSGARVTVLDSGVPGGQSSRAAAGVAIPSVRLLDDEPMLTFTRSAREVLDEDLQSLPDHGALRRGHGILRVMTDPRARDALVEKAKDSPEWLGTWLDAAALVAREPALEGSPLLGAFHTEAGFMVDTEAYLNALLADVARLGVTLRLGTAAQGIREDATGVTVQTSSDEVRGEQLAVCAGAWAGHLPGLAPLPVRPVRGQMISVFHPGIRLTHIVSGPTYLAPWRFGEVVVGATEEEAGFACHVTPLGLVHLSATLAKLAPKLREAVFRTAWAGLRSASPDGRPLIGRWPGSARTFVATAHGGQGILTGALSGRMLAEWLQRGASESAAAFDPARFTRTGPGGAVPGPAGDEAVRA